MNHSNQKFINVLKELAVIEKVYQDIRIVDPITKEVLAYSNNELELLDFKCYEVWSRNSICENCISMRAFNENDSFIKIESTSSKIFVITAFPMTVDDRKVIVELIKDATNSLVIGDDCNHVNLELIKLINHANQMAITDDLTGIYNRRYINERLPIEIFLHRLENKPLSIIMTDLDYFKKVNDIFGHVAGDAILKEFTQLLTKEIRKGTDWVSRFGGEEFLICLPDTEKEMALKIAERMRKRIEDTNFVYEDNNINLTASFGVFTLENKCVEQMEELIDLTDKSLYRAKRYGKNRVEG